MRGYLLTVVTLLAILVAGCDKGESSSATKPAASSAQAVSFNLNWVPEPEFGGIYAAQIGGAFAKHGLDAKIVPGGAGAPTWQLVATGQADFAVASADEVIIARSRGADVLAIFATYQTCPQGIMVHASRELKSLPEVFKGGTLAVEPGLPYVKYLEKKYGFGNVKVVAYSGGIAEFLANKGYAQQCFVTSEPLTAKAQGSDPQTFLVAEAGYNPYTAVIITRGSYLKDHPETVKAMRSALLEGWQAYLENPKSANDQMAKLNKGMDAATFAATADAQKSLIIPDPVHPELLGTMTLDRWKTLVEQLRSLSVIDKDVSADQCFLGW